MTRKKKENTEQAVPTAPATTAPVDAADAERSEARARLWRGASARRRLVAELRARGRTVREIAAELRSNEQTVNRDIDTLRDHAAAGPLVTRSAACAALFSAEAEDVIRKVRALEDTYEGDDRKCTLFLNLLKLEFTMLVRCADIAGGLRTKIQGTTDDEELDDWNKLSNEEIIDRAKAFGIDTSGFERALAALGGAVDDDGGAATDAA